MTKTKAVLMLAVLVILTAVVGPFLVHVATFLVGAATTLALVGGASVVSYRLGRAAERRQLPRGS